MKCFFMFKSIFRPKVMLQSNLIPQGKPVLHQAALFVGKGKIKFGKKVHIGYFPSPYFYSTYAHIEARGETARVIIGDNTFISNNACIIADKTEIQIGSDGRIGANFCCFDSDFHGISPKHRDDPQYIQTVPIKIGNHVFIGQNVTVLKGVTIGDNVVIGSGAVVTKSFPDNVIIAGNPAKIIKEIPDD